MSKKHGNENKRFAFAMFGLQENELIYESRKEEKKLNVLCSINILVELGRDSLFRHMDWKLKGLRSQNCFFSLSIGFGEAVQSDG